MSKLPDWILSEPSQIENIASGSGIRDIARLRQTYGPGRWHKQKGVARVRLGNGSVTDAEIHWYEETGIGRVEFKIKYLL